VVGVSPAVLPLVTVPAWLLAGLALGAVLAAVVTAVFLIGQRLLPAGAAPGATAQEGGRHREIRRYLQAIEEPFTEEAAVEGHTVAFHLPERDVSITFDPRAYFAIEAAGRAAVLVEHELPGAYLGGRLPFETPDVETEPTDGDETAAVRAAFATLGLPPTADSEAVSDAYRKRAKEAHPDQGGDSEAFARLQEAYDTATEYADG
jgi:DnaJ-domain-containing protein 1